MILPNSHGVTRSVTTVTSRYLVTKINVRLVTSVTTISGLSQGLSHLESASSRRFLPTCDNCDKKLPIEDLKIEIRDSCHTFGRLNALVLIYAREAVTLVPRTE